MEKAFWILTGKYKSLEKKEKTADGQDLYPPGLPFLYQIFLSKTYWI